jgi:hypothetical protein
MKMIKKIALFFSGIVFFQSCNSVREYEKEKINDPDMKLSARTSERYETAFQVYREAAAGANGGKSGGGCGCN